MSHIETRRFPRNYPIRLQTACFHGAFVSISENTTQEELWVFLELAEVQESILNRSEADILSSAGVHSSSGAWSGKMASASVLSDGITPFCKSV